MPSITDLPLRSNAINYDPDQVEEVYNLLDQVEKGQGVIVDDDAQETDGKARNRARIMRDALVRYDDDSTVKSFRTHSVETDDGYYAVVSRRASKND